MFRRSLRAAAPLTLPIHPKKDFLFHSGGKDDFPTKASETVTLEGSALLDQLRLMLRMRWMETQCHALYQQKKIRGFCHLYIGQEAIAAGMEDVLTLEDSVVTGYRDHCWYLTRGGTCEAVIAEMMGKQAGASKGKGGSMHMYLAKNNFYGGNGIVGAQAAIGAGLGWAYSLRNGLDSPKNVSVALYGDGAANQGQLFESLNISALNKVPCIFVCENNHFGMGTGDVRASANPMFYSRCEYVPGIRCDGMNIFAVIEATRIAKEWCLAGKGPVVLEMDSYRYKGHSMSDPDTAYRTRDDIRKVRDERDCILHLRTVIEEHGLATKADMDAMEKAIKADTMAAIRAAGAGPTTLMKEFASDIYAEHVPVRTCQGTVFVE